ncbi:MAG: OB-fold domain-containing protein [Deltaproteobacteria bacterium]|nr:OB-fold domain-containing protein [Deltaproteobacteria bacterium]
MTERIPVIEGLFTEGPEGPRLLGSRCVTCATPYFPKSLACHNPSCTEGRMEDAAFGPRGVLFSSAVQNYPPPPPAKYDEPYRPYAVGMVDLAEGLRVLGRIDTPDPSALRGGTPVELSVGHLYRDTEGRDVVTWQFRPC